MNKSKWRVYICEFIMLNISKGFIYFIYLQEQEEHKVMVQGKKGQLTAAL